MNNLFLLSDGTILNLDKVSYIRIGYEEIGLAYFSHLGDYMVISIEDYRKICEHISVSKQT